MVPSLRSLLLALSVLLPAGAAGAAVAADPTGPDAAGADPAAGAVVWQRDCAFCHGDRGEGSQQGPPLFEVGTASVDFMVRTGRMPAPIDAPGRPARPDVAYDEATIDALVAYTAAFVRGPSAAAAARAAAPAVVATADVAAGGETYRLQCAACHQAVGRGGVLAYGTDVPDLQGASALEVVAAMRVGPGSMPAFPASVIDDRRAAAVAAAIAELQQPEDRGGLGLWHLGPVPEGLVAWALGLGGALTACRWLGTRTPTDDRQHEETT